MVYLSSAASIQPSAMPVESKTNKRRDEFMKRFGLSYEDLGDDDEEWIKKFHAVRSDEENKDIEVRNGVFEIIAKDYHWEVAKDESRKERNEKELKSSVFTYGEIEFVSFYQVLIWIKKTYKDADPDCWHNAFNNLGGVFMDLGHGSGKGILAAALMHEFESCQGIELLENLHALSAGLKNEYDQYVAEMEEDKYAELFKRPKSSSPSFVVLQGDILKIDWSNSDFVFCNSTCFTGDLMSAIAEQSVKLKKGTFFMTMSKKLPNASKIERLPGQSPTAIPEHLLEPLDWELILAIKLKMTWGMATVHVQRKISHPKS